MRRWLIVVLLVLLPTQFSWAAAASYCRHETGAASEHFGHHDHKHQGVKVKAGQDERSDENSSSGQVDGDCGICQLSCAQPVFPSHALAIGMPTEAVAPAAPRPYESHIPDLVEQPDRALDR